MIQSEHILKILEKNNINFFSGVPDSVLSKFTQIIKKKHIVAVNEGSAVAIAIGRYIKTKKISCVYMQNSGLGNSINPLISLASRDVYSIPMILIKEGLNGVNFLKETKWNQTKQTRTGTKHKTKQNEPN